MWGPPEDHVWVWMGDGDHGGEVALGVVWEWLGGALPQVEQ